MRKIEHLKKEGNDWRKIELLERKGGLKVLVRERDS